MGVVFQALFSWSEPFRRRHRVGHRLVQVQRDRGDAPGAFTDLITNGVIAGVGNVLVFVPQIALLFVFITFLEDSGYLARVAFVINARWAASASTVARSSRCSAA